MVRQKFSALAVAMSICVMASSAVQAETALPKTTAMNVAYGKSPLFPPVISSPAREAFAGPYDLLVAETADRNSLGMILASMGLMALIAHRRRMPS